MTLFANSKQVTVLFDRAFTLLAIELTLRIDILITDCARFPFLFLLSKISILRRKTLKQFVFKIVLKTKREGLQVF